MRFNENEEFDVLGFLDESMPKVHINPNDQLYFFIELLSPFPKSVNANVNRKRIQIYANELFRFDFVDDIRYSADPNKRYKDNYLWRHGQERKKIYLEQHFPVYEQKVNFS